MRGWNFSSNADWLVAVLLVVTVVAAFVVDHDARLRRASAYFGCPVACPTSRRTTSAPGLSCPGVLR